MAMVRAISHSLFTLVMEQQCFCFSRREGGEGGEGDLVLRCRDEREERGKCWGVRSPDASRRVVYLFVFSVFRENPA